MLDEYGAKWLRARRLIELLETLPQESRVTTNMVGNLLVLTANGEEYFAFVDLSDEGQVEFLRKDTGGE